VLSVSQDRGKIRRVVIISRLADRFDLGDIVMSNAVLRYARLQFPDARIALFARREELERYQERFYVPHSWVDEFHPCPPLVDRSIVRWLGLYARLRAQRADVCITNIRGLPAWLLLLAGIPRRVGFLFLPIEQRRFRVWRIEDWVLLLNRMFLTHPVTVSLPDMMRIHWSDFARAYGEALSGASTFEVRQVVPFVRYDEEVLETGLQKPVVVVHIGGAAHWNRRWPRESYLELCARLVHDLDATIALVGGMEERSDTTWLADNLQRRCPQGRVRDLMGCTLNRMLNLYARSDLFVGNDSGLMHLAVAAGLPVVALFGPSRHLFWGPDRIDPRHQVVTCNLPCAAGVCQIGCPVHYDMAAPDYPACMKRIDVESVWTAILRSLGTRVARNPGAEAVGSS